MKYLVITFLVVFSFIQCQNEPASNAGLNVDNTSTTSTDSTAGNQLPKSNPVQASNWSQQFRPKTPPTGHTEIGNFEYWHHIKNEGPKPLPSQAVFYSYRIMKMGQFVQGNFGGDPSGGIMPSIEEASKNPQALAEAMRRMAVGDSVTIIYPTKFPDTFFVYDIVLRGIYNR